MDIGKENYREFEYPSTIRLYCKKVKLILKYLGVVRIYIINIQ